MHGLSDLLVRATQTVSLDVGHDNASLVEPLLVASRLSPFAGEAAGVVDEEDLEGSGLGVGDHAEELWSPGRLGAALEVRVERAVEPLFARGGIRDIGEIEAPRLGELDGSAPLHDRP